MAEDEDDISALLRVRNALIDEYPAAFEDVPLNQQFSASQQAILANILTVPGVTFPKAAEWVDKDINLAQLKEELRYNAANQKMSRRKLNFEYGGLLCWRFGVNSCFRKFAISVVEHGWFENLVLLGIVTNCALISFDEFSPITEPIFFVFFSIEMSLKMIAMGPWACGKFSYLRDPWNVLDFILIVSSSLIFFPNLQTNLSFLRIFRIMRSLRALRAINALKELRDLVESMLGALSMLGNVLILVAFSFMLFGLLGMELYQGAQYRRCFWIDTSGSAFLNSSLVLQPCGGIFQCPSGEVCADAYGLVERPQFSFDNIFDSLTVMVMVVSLEGWTDLLYSMWDCVGTWSTLYFLALVILMSYFTVQLITGVIYENFRRVSDQPTAESVPDSAVSVVPYSQRLNAWSSSQWLDRMVVVAIVLNIIVLGSHFYLQPEWLTTLQTTANWVFIGMFTFEFFVKLIGLSVQGYFADPFNSFDFVIVIISLSELFLHHNSAISGLRSLRLLRVFKLARKWTGLREVLSKVASSVKQLAYFLLLLCVFGYIYILLGILLFEGLMRDADGGPSRVNFDSFPMAAIATFQVITSENWNDILVMGRAARGLLGSLFIYSLYALGNYLMLNMFVVILLKAFTAKSKSLRQFSRSGLPASVALEISHSVLKQEQTSDSLLALLDAQPISTPSAGAATGNLNYQYIHLAGAGELEMQTLPQLGEEASDHSEVSSHPSGVVGPRSPHRLFQPALRVPGSAESATASPTASGADNVNPDCESESAKLGKAQKVVQHTGPGRVELSGVSLGIFGPTNNFRARVFHLVVSKVWERFILGSILLSAVVLCLESPNLDPNTAFATALATVGVATSMIFICECLLKIFAFGLYQTPHAYLHSNWNKLDLAVASLSVLDMVLSWLHPSSDISWLRSVRTFRALRPLRIVSRNEQMLVILGSIMRALPELSQVFLVALLFYVCLTFLGMDLMMGKLAVCQPVTMGSPLSASTGSGDELTAFARSLNQTQCDLHGFLWANPPTGNFDNFAAGLLSLYELSTLESWPSHMYSALDSSEVGAAPIENNSLSLAAYYVFCIFVLNFFINNLFVGVIVSNFSLMIEVVGGSHLLTQAQQDWVELYRLLLLVRHDGELIQKPNGRFKQWAWRVVTDSERPADTGNRFDIAMGWIVMLNIAQLACLHLNASEKFEYSFLCIDTVFVVLFFGEMALKIAAMDGRYLYSKWNIFECAVVWASAFDIFMAICFPDVTVPALSILRLNRIFRVLRLVRKTKKLRVLLETLVASLPVLSNVGLLIILALIIFGIAAMHLFAKMPYRTFLTPEGNFETFPMAVLTLFRCVTGENWNGIMHDLMPRTPGLDCNATQEGDCGSYAAVPFFVAFQLLMTFILVNLFSAVLLEEFERAMTLQRQEQREGIVTPADFRMFSELWVQYSLPAGWWESMISTFPHEYMSWSRFTCVLTRLKGSLAISSGRARPTLMEIRKWLPVRLHKRVVQGERGPTVDYQVHYVEVLLALCLRMFKLAGNAEEVQNLEKMRASVVRLSVLTKNREHQFKQNSSVNLVPTEETSVSEYSLLAMISSERVQAAYRGAKARKSYRLMRAASVKRHNSLGRGRNLSLVREGSKEISFVNI